MTEKQLRQVFDGIKVADFTWAATGPQATKVLAQHGATVVKVESHRRRISFGSSYDTNKYGITLDLAKPEGKEIGMKLARWADIVVEAFQPGTMKKFGLDYEQVRKIKPDIIYCSTSFLGQYGPLGGLAGWGEMGGAMAGITLLTGYPDRGPAMAETWYVDYLAPWYLVTALVLALERRHKTGKGMYIDHAQFESAVTFLSPAILDYGVNDRIMSSQGNRNPYAAPHGIYPCKDEDRWVAIAVFTDEEWQAFGNALGNPEWIGQSRFATFLDRKENEDELDRLIADWTTGFTAEQVMTLMQANGVASGVVQNIRDLFADPQLKEREHFIYLKQTDAGNRPYKPYKNEAFKFSKTPQKLWKAGPNLGEDNEHVYKEILGFSDDDISRLLADGVITTDQNRPG